MSPGRRRIGIRVMIGVASLGWVATAVACGLLHVETESVLVTGPILVVFGVVMMAGGRLLRFWPVVGLGIALGAVSALYVWLVNWFEWSPRDAELPFILMGWAFLLLVATPLTVLTWLRPPKAHEPWECAKCGYPLHGLSSSACPECGTSFDPATVEAASRGSF